MTIECPRAYILLYANGAWNCIVLECIRQVITQVPLGSDPVGFLDAGIPHEGRIMAVGADQDGNGSFGDFFSRSQRMDKASGGRSLRIGCLFGCRWHLIPKQLRSDGGV